MAGERETGLVDDGALLAMIERLQRDRVTRDARGLFFAEGVRNFVQALAGGYRAEAIVYSEKLLTSSAARKLVRDRVRAGVRAVSVSPEEFRRISLADHASGVSAVMHQRVEPLHRVAPRPATCWLVVNRVRSTGNLGSLLRTSAAVGGGGLVLVGGATDPYDPALVRATMGALFAQRIVRTGAAQLAHWARRHALQVVGASPEASRPYDRIAYRRPTLLVLGEERAGLDDEQRALCHELVRIPMVPGTDSLNLAVAGSLLMYEAFRRGHTANSGPPAAATK
jgi:TrmH family RNA methyltransferase